MTTPASRRPFDRAGRAECESARPGDPDRAQPVAAVDENKDDEFTPKDVRPIITLAEARRLALERVSTIPSNHEIILLDDHVVETADAWYFPYNGREYIETGVISSALAGNHPVRVAKRGGDVTLQSPDVWKTL